MAMHAAQSRDCAQTGTSAARMATPQVFIRLLAAAGSNGVRGSLLGGAAVVGEDLGALLFLAEQLVIFDAFGEGFGDVLTPDACADGRASA